MIDTVLVKESESWLALRKELRKRTVKPIYHVSFVMYFFIAVFLVGGIGIWSELYSYFLLAPKTSTESPSLGPLRTAVITFFPALAGTASMQLIWAAEDNQKYLRAFAFFMLVLLSAVALMIASTAAIQHDTALYIGIVASAFALWTWWIANAKQQAFLDIDASLGKRDPQAQLAGNLDDFTV